MANRPNRTSIISGFVACLYRSLSFRQVSLSLRKRETRLWTKLLWMVGMNVQAPEHNSSYQGEINIFQALTLGFPLSNKAPAAPVMVGSLVQIMARSMACLQTARPKTSPSCVLNCQG